MGMSWRGSVARADLRGTIRPLTRLAIRVVCMKAPHMPTRIYLVGLATAVALIGCSGDDPVKQQTRQTRQVQAQPASFDGQQADEAQPSDQEDAQEPGPQARVDDSGRLASEDTAENDLLALAFAAKSEWIESLDTAVFDVQVDIEHAGSQAAINTRVTLRRSPIAVLGSTDVSQLLSFLRLMGGEGEHAHDEPTGGLVWHRHELLAGEKRFATVSGSLLSQLPPFADASEFEGQPQFPGWADISTVRAGSLSEEPWLGGLVSVFLSFGGIGPAEPTYLNGFIGLEQFEPIFTCIEDFGGTVVADEEAAEPVWVLECAIGTDILISGGLSLVTGQETEPDAVIEPNHFDLSLRLVVSQHTGAPLGLETVWRYRLQGEEDDHLLSGTLRLLDWNQQVDLPDLGSPVDALWFDSVNAWLLSVDERRRGILGRDFSRPRARYRFIAEWAAAVDELSAEYNSTLMIGGERHVASTNIRSSRSRRAYESESSFGDGSVARLLWTRDGFWVSNEEQEGNPVWVTSLPAHHGFRYSSREKFLSSWSRIKLDLFDPLYLREGEAGDSSTSAGADVRVLRLSRETLREGDSNFGGLSEDLRALVSELVGVDVRVDEITEHTTTIHYHFYTGEILSLITESTFVADGMPAELTIAATFGTGGGISFSDPNNAR